MDHVALHCFIPVYLETDLTRFGRKFNVLQNKLLTLTADNGRVRGMKMNAGASARTPLATSSQHSARTVRSPLSFCLSALFYFL